MRLDLHSSNTRCLHNNRARPVFQTFIGEVVFAGGPAVGEADDGVIQFGYQKAFGEEGDAIADARLGGRFGWLKACGLDGVTRDGKDLSS